eukprot:gnl/TRDRNA2_/TRDRNA2_176575_c0_seq1.p1 gnl/TRDRNA2_/TRDRNA2_176575_c0~~gnl/TRDRNA2_/TRDRNA2_176575_c0_seq1.p1  ORF type:complete len:476 (+),score=69.27 gnl/TRDRNA2_/TRDRNA2_176575_c0_seq1:62-1489(+)
MAAMRCPELVGALFRRLPNHFVLTACRALNRTCLEVVSSMYAPTAVSLVLHNEGVSIDETGMEVMEEGIWLRAPDVGIPYFAVVQVTPIEMNYDANGFEDMVPHISIELECKKASAAVRQRFSLVSTERALEVHALRALVASSGQLRAFCTSFSSLGTLRRLEFRVCASDDPGKCLPPKEIESAIKKLSVLEELLWRDTDSRIAAVVAAAGSCVHLKLLCIETCCTALEGDAFAGLRHHKRLEAFEWHGESGDPGDPSYAPLLDILATTSRLAKVFVSGMSWGKADEIAAAVRLLQNSATIQSFGMLPLGCLRSQAVIWSAWPACIATQSYGPVCLSIREVSLTLGEPTALQVSALLEPIPFVFPNIETLRLQALEFNFPGLAALFLKFVSSCGSLKTVHFSTFFNSQGSRSEKRFLKSLQKMAIVMKERFPSIALIFHHWDALFPESGGLWGASYWLPRDLASGSPDLSDRPGQ